MGKLDSLYNKYFQKSRVFLYPQLKIPKEMGIIPLDTFVKWDDKIHESERKLICVYQKRKDPDWMVFEQTRIKENPMFHSINITDQHTAVVFNLESIACDWDRFLDGKYSEFSYPSKRNIGNYFGNKTSQSVYIDSYVNPHKYFDIYSRLIGESVEDLKITGQLCDKPNLKRESFNEHNPIWKIA